MCLYICREPDAASPAIRGELQRVQGGPRLANPQSPHVRSTPSAKTPCLFLTTGSPLLSTAAAPRLMSSGGLLDRRCLFLQKPVGSDQTLASQQLPQDLHKVVGALEKHASGGERSPRLPSFPPRTNLLAILFVTCPPARTKGLADG